MSISIVISSTFSKIFLYSKKIFLFFKKHISWILFFLLLISVSLNVILLSHYQDDQAVNKLVVEYENNGLEVKQIDCSNIRTSQANRAKLLAYLIFANSKYTSNPQKYVDDVEYTSGTTVYINCDDK